jgi:hypothetical protein
MLYRTKEDKTERKPKVTIWSIRAEDTITSAARLHEHLRKLNLFLRGGSIRQKQIQSHHKESRRLSFRSNKRNDPSCLRRRPADQIMQQPKRNNDLMRLDGPQIRGWGLCPKNSQRCAQRTQFVQNKPLCDAQYAPIELRESPY